MSAEREARMGTEKPAKGSAQDPDPETGGKVSPQYFGGIGSAGMGVT